MVLLLLSFPMTAALVLGLLLVALAGLLALGWLGGGREP
jgi:hypothetical protein